MISEKQKKVKKRDTKKERVSAMRMTKEEEEELHERLTRLTYPLNALDQQGS